MVKSKKMNESSFERLVKELNSTGEMIRTYQDEKQTVIDDFETERKRFRDGKISKATLASSSKKSNKELAKLDKKIRESIQKSNSLGQQIRKFVVNQSPKIIRVKVSNGKKAVRKSPAKKKSVRKKVSKKSPAKKKSVRKKAVKKSPAKKKSVKRKVSRKK